MSTGGGGDDGGCGGGGGGGGGDGGGISSTAAVGTSGTYLTVLTLPGTVLYYNLTLTSLTAPRLGLTFGEYVAPTSERW